MSRDEEKTQARINAGLAKLGRILLLVKATGGYKYRENIRGSDKEIRDATDAGLLELADLVVSYTVAREMLGELPPSGCHARLEEFIRRRDEVKAALEAQVQEQAKIIPFRPLEDGAQTPGAAG